MTTPVPHEEGAPERLDLEAAELEAAVAAVKRRLGVETAEARVIAARLPERLRTRFWESCLHEVLGTELAIAEAATRSGFVKPGDHDRLRAELERVTRERDEARTELDRLRPVAEFLAQAGTHPSADKPDDPIEILEKINHPSLVKRLDEERRPLEAEIAAMRPVFGAALAWADNTSWMPYLGTHGTALYRAVESYRASGDTP